MRGEALFRGVMLMVFAALITISLANPYMEEEPDHKTFYTWADNREGEVVLTQEDGLEELEDYDNNLERFLQQTQEKRGSRIYTPIRRSCIRRGGNCDHQHENCCYNSTCRCNLWGSNCRCQRMGLFQKWGK